MSKSNKSMAWIRDLEMVTTRTPDKHYRLEFEIASENRIIGILNYANGFIRCGPLTLEKDERGMFRYLIHLTTPVHSEEDMKEWDKADEEGYSFPGGYAEELLALFSVFFRCRFYLISTSQGEMNDRGMELRQLNSFIYRKPNPKIHPPIFQDQELGWGAVSKFLDKIKNLPDQWHRRFALACHHYLKALKEVGIDEEMIFIKLVSAVECLMEKPLEAADDSFENKSLSDFCDLSKLNQSAKDSIQSWYNDTRHVKKRFLNFIKKYSEGYLPTPGTVFNKIDTNNLEAFLEAIYEARSGYLHEGKSMYLSRLFPRDSGDFDPSYGQIIDQRTWDAKELLPYPHFFEGLVRHCILNFLEQKSRK